MPFLPARPNGRASRGCSRSPSTVASAPRDEEVGSRRPSMAYLLKPGSYCLLHSVKPGEGTDRPGRPLALV